ncbi:MULTISPECIES: hypothetical protein [Microbacterium]|uniref:Uncharacterized protein n=1 Tax=Microbacterium wangchenii TaxID=2541726 RepID=A0ABX5SPX9_9MICO|nr:MULTISPECIES: hypothetical protein [Microbacterium]MCK6066896.1 hypothetical protein [Microbacterium sp. EYE_512]QBR88201.1 hypothetical protein E4K62_05525 [Microbacterium wangchenii]TFV83679.1 hypothetical protein E4V99_00860 [Microbacterium sp. dk485]TXK18009.1 hypothetical protein FVP99_05275 [Microbacterium wangchenii]
MKRIDIVYGGRDYSVSGRELDDLQNEIESLLAGAGHWLQVSIGDGEPQPTYLYLSPGTPIALVPVPEP